MRLVSTILCSVIAIASAQTPAVEDFQISGLVVDHLTNRPLNHVLVEIVRTGKGGGDASALTEADGRFIFLHVPKGKYQLLAEKRGQAPQSFQSDGPFSTAIVVDGKQKTDGIVFPMNTDGAINGTVFGDDGEPLRSAQISLFEESVNDGEAQTIQTKGVSTNSAGQFHFGHLRPGKYYISAQASPWFGQAGAEIVYPITFYGDTNDGKAARAIVLAEGGSADAQITLHAVPGIHVKLAGQSRGLGLFVAGPGGTQIPVAMSSTGTGGRGRAMAKRGGMRPEPNLITANQEQEGQVELTNIAAGRYEAVQFGDRNLPGTPHTVELSNGSTIGFEPPPSSLVSGTLIFDTPRPVGELQVFLSGGKQRGAMAEVAADGTFKFDRLTEGSFSVRLNRPGLSITSMTAQGARMVHDDLEISAGASAELTIRVSSSETLSAVEGFAMRDGAGVPGAMVLLLPQDLGRVRLMHRDQSDSDGSFSLAGVQPGRYTLIAIDEGKGLAYKDETVIKPYLKGGLAVTVPLKSNDPLEVPIQQRKR